MSFLRTDLEFLLQLDERLHKTHSSIFTPNMSGVPFEVLIDTYTKVSMNAREIQKVLKTIGRNDFTIYPISTEMGLAVGFQVANPDTKEALLTFKESQLPRNYNFNRLSEYFMQPENVERAKSLGVSIINGHSHYDY